MYVVHFVTIHKVIAVNAPWKNAKPHSTSLALKSRNYFVKKLTQKMVLLRSMHTVKIIYQRIRAAGCHLNQCKILSAKNMKRRWKLKQKVKMLLGFWTKFSCIPHRLHLKKDVSKTSDLTKLANEYIKWINVSNKMSIHLIFVWSFWWQRKIFENRKKTPK